MHLVFVQPRAAASLLEHGCHSRDAAVIAAPQLRAGAGEREPQGGRASFKLELHVRNRGHATFQLRLRRGRTSSVPQSWLRNAPNAAASLGISATTRPRGSCAVSVVFCG